MARARINSALLQVRGTIDDWCYKQYAGRVVISRRPDMSRVKWSPKQMARRKLMRAAGAFHRQVLADPALKKRYLKIAKEKGHPLSAVTMGDYMRRHPLP